MEVWQHVDGSQGVPVTGRSVATVGNFDGVHRGHQHVLARTVEAAERLLDEQGASGDRPPVVATTFEPHPLAVLAPDKAPLRLTTARQRAHLLHAAGADVVAALAFGSEMAAWSPEEFVRRVLVEQLHAAVVVVGQNFRFGHRAQGDVAALREIGAGLPDGEAFEVDALELDGGDPPWSSTLVRRLLADGEVEAAAEVLGRPASVEGVVVRGDQRGRELGYPTANLPVPHGVAVPADGVYAGWLRRLDDDPAHDGAPLPAAVSVGTNPTFDGVERRVEAYVLDRTDLDLYGVEVEISMTDRIRGQVRYDGIDALVAQMADDVDTCRRLLLG